MAAVLRQERIEPAPGAIRVMVIDDSLTVRTVFSRMIDRESGLAVVAQASTAEQALTMLKSAKVDVVLLDLEMPGMGGLEALPHILGSCGGAKVLVVSSLTADGAEATMKALQMGAADTMLKPRPGGFDENYRATLLGKIHALGGKLPKPAAAKLAPAPARAASAKPLRVVAIGASTGGIHALNLFLRRLPAQFDLPILITQHLPESFIPVFAQQMATAANREAVLADEGTEILPGRIIIAPGHGHMTVKRTPRGLVTGLAYHPVKSGCRPSVDPMFETLAEATDGQAAAVLLSGMGRDGTEGAERIAALGGSVYAQDANSCAVWGMSRSVAERGIACAVCPPEELADKIVASVGSKPWL